MFNKIIIALDRSETSKKIFEQGLSLAKLTSAKLMLLHVLSSDDISNPNALTFPNADYYASWGQQDFNLYQERWEAFKNEGWKMLQSFAAQANTQGINTEFTQNSGSPGRVICELAKVWQADTIIMGRRGRSGLTELLLGSVSNYVLHHAPCSVYIVNLPVSSQPLVASLETSSTSG